MTDLKKLLKKRGPVEEKKTSEQKMKEAITRLEAGASVEEAEEGDEIDRKALASMLGRLREKYKREGYLKEVSEEESERSKQMKKIMEGGVIGVKEAGAEELLGVQSPIVKVFAQFYLSLEAPLKFFRNALQATFGKSLERNLIAARMNYTPSQYLTIVTSATIITWLVYFLFATLFIVTGTAALGPLIAGALFAPFLILIVGILIPSSNAAKVASNIEKDLPFALRHMSIEIRAGVGIFKTMQSIAESGYGELSIGFQKVLSDISKGVPTEDALENWSNLMGSEALKRVVTHIVRALKTGSNLSDIMVTIAEDVTFERKAKIQDYAQKLNLMSLFLMMIAIVLPVMAGVLTAVASSPSITRFVSFFAGFDTSFLTVIYFIIIPGLLTMFLFFIKAGDPGT